MWKQLITAAMFAATVLAGVEPAAAAGPGGFARNLLSNPTVSFIVATKPTLAPFAHVRFCVQNPSQCSAGGGASVMVMTSYREAQLRRINAQVNGTIRPTNEATNTDVWQIGANAGDCEDFALTKRQRLIAAGWSPRALRMAVVRTRSGEGHAVLVVKTNQGDLVLDNRTGAIKPWKNTDLRWVKIQSSDNPKRWFTM